MVPTTMLKLETIERKLSVEKTIWDWMRQMALLMEHHDSDHNQYQSLMDHNIHHIKHID